MGFRHLVLVILAPAMFVTHTAAALPALRYDKPGGFAGASSEDVETWISDGLDGVIHIYAFRPFHGDFQSQFRRSLFRDRIGTAYREDRLLAAPAFRTMAVEGADMALIATFRSFNGGAPREHRRVAVLSAGRIALVDISANSPQAFERNWPSVSRLLNSLQVVGVGL